MRQSEYEALQFLFGYVNADVVHVWQLSCLKIWLGEVDRWPSRFGQNTLCIVLFTEIYAPHWTGVGIEEHQNQNTKMLNLEFTSHNNHNILK